MNLGSEGWSWYFICIHLPHSPCGCCNHCLALPGTCWALLDRVIHPYHLLSHPAWISFNILSSMSVILPWNACLPLPGFMSALAASASLGNLLEMWILRRHPRPPGWEISGGGGGLAICAFIGLPGDWDACQSLRTFMPGAARMLQTAELSWVFSRNPSPGMKSLMALTPALGPHGWEVVTAPNWRARGSSEGYLWGQSLLRPLFLAGRCLLLAVSSSQGLLSVCVHPYCLFVCYNLL